ncbi:melatonin receptor type 1B-like [Amphiura filiformis]|uniref:melatonin receptor type 1B-like n=1 Tax=Amphiura filiformis TaxID=82378 RepID=UPI003B2152F8
MTITVTILGVFGNLLVLATLVMDRKLRVLNNLFLANLALADLFIAGIIHPFTAAGIMGKKEHLFFQDQESDGNRTAADTTGDVFLQDYESGDNREITYLCEFLASFCIISCSASVLSIGAVAMNRYVYICHNRSYQKIYNRYTIPIMVALIWVTGALVDLPTYFGFGNHVFHQRISSCFFDTTHPHYKWFFVIVGIFTPVAATVYCYVRILYLVHKSNKRLRNRSRNAPTSKHDNSIKSADVRLLKTVAAMGVLAVVIYTPFSITLLADNGQVPVRVWRFSNGLMHSFSCFNWFIYALTNNRIRDGMRLIIKKLTCCRCVTEGQEMEMTATGTSGARGNKTIGTSSGGLSSDFRSSKEDIVENEKFKKKGVNMADITI